MTNTAEHLDIGDIDAERRRHLAWKEQQIAEARADVAAGRLVNATEVDAWIGSIGTAAEMPVPSSGR